MRVDEIDGGRAPCELSQLERSRRFGREADCGEKAACVRAGEEQAAALGGDVGELDVVHDDEVVEVGEEL